MFRIELILSAYLNFLKYTQLPNSVNLVKKTPRGVLEILGDEWRATSGRCPGARTASGAERLAGEKATSHHGHVPPVEEEAHELTCETVIGRFRGILPDG